MAQTARPKSSAEAGVAGNTNYYGYDGGGEYLRELTGSAGRLKFEEMRRSDAQVYSVLQALTLPILKAEYAIEPPSDSSQDKLIADTITQNLKEGMSMTWEDTLRHALLMYPFGFSILEKIWMLKDNLFQIDKLAPRLPNSVVRWDRDQQRELLGPVQQDTDGKEYLLPMDKILIFSLGKEGDNWEGTSILRAAYKPWFIKSKLEKINAIKHERHGVGMPKVRVPDGTTRDSDTWRDAEQLIENMLAHENAYVIIPGSKEGGWDVEILGAGSENAGTDTLPSIKYYDEQIAKSALAMFIMLGTTETGSRALGMSFVEVFLDSLQFVADYISSVMSRFLIRQYVDFNWKVGEYPIMRASQIKTLDSATIAVLKNAGLITSTVEVEQALRKAQRLPELTDEQIEGYEEAHKAPVTAPDEEDPDTEKPEEETEKPDPKKEKKAHEHKTGVRLAERPDAERHIDLKGIETRLDEAQDMLKKELIKMKDAQTEAVLRQVIGGKRIQDIAVPLKQDMHRALMREFKKQVQRGRLDVQIELKNQGAKLADSTPGPDQLMKIIEEELAILVEGSANKLAAQLATFAVELKRSGLSGTDLERSVREMVHDRLTDRTWEDMATSTVNRGWGAGRDIEMRISVDLIEYCYYSAILDSAACDFCRVLDGQKHEVNDPTFVTPNPHCLGMGRCRCLTVVVAKAESRDED